MTYGTIKVDTVTFTDAGIDKSVTLSGLVQNPVFSGNVTVTGTLSGVTVTGTTANFTSGNFTNISGGTHTITSGVFAAGSAASPSITFTGDLNTGIYSPGADQVAISTGGSGRLFVDASGRVGISSAASASTNTYLQVGLAGIGSDHVLYDYDSYFANNLYKSGSSTWSRISARTGGLLRINDDVLTYSTANSGTAGASATLSERLRITSAGLVGVGTSSPGATLHVNGGSASRTGYFVSTDASAYSPTSYSQYHRLYLQGGSATNAYNGIGFTNGSNSEGFIGFVQNASGYGDFVIQSFAGSYAEKLRVTSAGNVGVGTTSPSSLLHLVSSGQPTITVADDAGRTLQIKSPDSSANPGFLGTTTNHDLLLQAGITAGGLNVIRFNTAGSERARIDSSGRLLVGTSNQDVGGAVAGVKLDPSGQVFASSDTAGLFYDNPFYGDRRNTAGDGPIYVLARQGYYKAAIGCTTGGGTANEGVLTFYTATNSGFNERARIDSSGRLLVGTSSARSNFYNDTNSARFQVEGTDNDGAAIAVVQNFAANTIGAQLILAKSNLTSVGSNTLVAAGDRCGNISFQGNDGTQFVETAAITGVIDGTPGANDMPGRLVFSTTADGANSPAERMRIDSSGRVGIGTTPTDTLTVNGGIDIPANYTINLGSDQGGGATLNYNPNGNLDIAPRSGFSTVFLSTFGGSERARIDSSGRLLVGTSTSIESTSKLQVKDGSLNIYHANAAAGAGYAILFTTDGSSSALAQAKIEGLQETANTSGGRLVFSTSASGSGSPTERMRITNNGYLKVSNNGTYIDSASSYHEICTTTNNTVTLYTRSAAANGQQYGVLIETLNDQNDGTRYFLQGAGGGIERATLRSNGGLANYSANNVNLASDIRLKKDITPLATTWNKVKEIEVVNFRYKDCNENDPLLYGVIAQQVQPIVPELVVVTRKAQEAQDAELDDKGKIVKEAVEAAPEYYGIREQPMYWLAIKALQEAMERIEVLEQRLTDAGIA